MSTLETRTVLTLASLTRDDGTSSRAPITVADLTLADGSLREVSSYDLPIEVWNVNTVQDGIYRANEQVRRYNVGIARDRNRLCGTSLVERALVGLESWVDHAIVEHVRDLEHRRGDAARAAAADARRAAAASA